MLYLITTRGTPQELQGMLQVFGDFIKLAIDKGAGVVCCEGGMWRLFQCASQANVDGLLLLKRRAAASSASFQLPLPNPSFIPSSKSCFTPVTANLRESARIEYKLA